MNIYEILEEEFLTRGYTWKIVNKDGEEDYFFPKADDLERMVDKAITDLYDARDASIVEVGRLIIQKNDPTYDVYLHIGEVK